jgi:mono/diheme cytochrome c family protein
MKHTISFRNATTRPVRALAWLAGGVFSLAVALAAVDPGKLPPAAARAVDFRRDIRPIFEASCLKCHGPEKQKGGFRLDKKDAAFKGGENYTPAIKPGQSAESPLIHLVAGLVEDLRMPQNGPPLSAEQIGLLRAWIDQGAPWPDEAASDEATPAAKSHWAFRPVARPPVPVTPYPARNDVDRFIGAELERKKLTPSPEADRRALMRRLAFDLLGLPPTPEEVDAFLADARPEAYEQLVERFLASPHYGERWARHWLDVVRFAETTGFEVNTPRPNAWPYRDYVIRAFNDDKPYDRFVLEQLAGDALGEDAATGFLVAGPDDKVKSPDPVLTANQRADELHDMVSTTGSTFLGLTVGCARCHNHKFDPIPQTDYYAVKAVFEGVLHGDRKMRTPTITAEERELAERRRRLTVIDAKLAEFEPLADPTGTAALRAPVHARLNVERFAATPAKRLRFTITKTTGAEPCIDELEVYTAEAAPRNIALANAGTVARASSVFPNSDIHRLEHLNDGQYGNSRSWISNERGQGWLELDFSNIVAISRVVWGRDREQKFADRLAIEYRVEVATGSNDWHVVAASVDRAPFVAGQKPAPFFAGLSPAELAEAKKLVAERAEHESRITELGKAPMIYGGLFTRNPTPTHRLHRGDPMAPREVVEPGALGVVAIKCAAGDQADSQRSDAEKGSFSDDQRRRLALARWITDPANPLTARVMVNRIWQYHFGEGLVSTASDLGANGGRPTHPGLLDWLAAEFIARGWSVKAMHRLIVNSATYRQSSAPRPTCQAVDADARLLWRFPPRRLEAEPIRDLMLAVSGKLDLRMGGPGFSVFEPNDNYVRVYAPRKEFTPNEWRRMVYATVVRQRPDGVFGAFDCPDGGQIAPKRTRSTTPLQALNLLNSGFVMQQAGFLAERLQTEAGSDPGAEVQRAFKLAFNRSPDAEELGAATRLVREHGLMAFCRALFNANEFVYVF